MCNLPALFASLWVISVCRSEVVPCERCRRTTEGSRLMRRKIHHEGPYHCSAKFEPLCYKSQTLFIIADILTVCCNVLPFLPAFQTASSFSSFQYSIESHLSENHVIKVELCLWFEKSVLKPIWPVVFVLSTCLCVLLFRVCFSWFGLGPIVPVKRSYNATLYNDILSNRFFQRCVNSLLKALLRFNLTLPLCTKQAS